MKARTLQLGVVLPFLLSFLTACGVLPREEPIPRPVAPEVVRTVQLEIPSALLRECPVNTLPSSENFHTNADLLADILIRYNQQLSCNQRLRDIQQLQDEWRTYARPD